MKVRIWARPLLEISNFIGQSPQISEYVFVDRGTFRTSTVESLLVFSFKQHHVEGNEMKEFQHRPTRKIRVSFNAGATFLKQKTKKKRMHPNKNVGPSLIKIIIIIIIWFIMYNI